MLHFTCVVTATKHLLKTERREGERKENIRRAKLLSHKQQKKNSSLFSREGRINAAQRKPWKEHMEVMKETRL
jgi:hypothetical protein